MKNTVVIEIPESIIKIMNDSNIPEDKRAEVFEQYIEYTTGIMFNTEFESFITFLKMTFLN